MSAYTAADRARALEQISASLADSIARNLRPLTEEEKKSRVIVSVNDQAEWQHSLLKQEDIDDLDMVDAWPEHNPPERRKDSEISNLLDLLDNLPTGKESK